MSELINSLIEKKKIIFFLLATNICLGFYKNNLYDFYKISHYTDLIKIFLIFFVILILIDKLIHFLIRNFFLIKKNYATAIFVCFFSILSFNFYNFKEFYLNLNLDRFALFAFLTILLLLFLLIAVLFYTKNLEKIIKFLCIYLLLTSIYHLCFISLNILVINKKSSNNEYELISKDQSKFKKSKNIYYVILDQMASLEKFQQYYNFKDAEIVKKKLDSYGGKYILNSRSSYNITPVTLGSIFEMDYFLTEKDNFFHNHNLIYPKILEQKKSNSKLLTLLKDNNYKFNFHGNSFANCNTILSEYCPVSLNNNVFFKNKFLVANFIETTYFNLIYNKFLKPDNNIKKVYHQNDAIRNFLELRKNNIIPNNKEFNFIHHFSPHPPYIYKENCELRYENNIYDLNKNSHQGYYQSYICALNRAFQLLEFLKKNDPNSIVVIQGDHGHDFKKYDEEKMKNRISIFNYMKFENKCLNNKQIIDNVISINLIIYCDLSNKKINKKTSTFYYKFKKNIFSGKFVRLF